MQKISSITATATPDGQFTNGSVATGVSPTILDAGWFNTIQDELVNVVQGAGLSLDPKNDAQVLAALKKLFLQRTNPFGDIAADGAAAISSALANLGLGNGSALPVGIPVAWPAATPPAGWLKCNGASFSATDYPKLASAYPSLKLPDLRGEFIRGWDDGRGADAGRALLSAQADALQNHGHRTIRLRFVGGSGGNFAIPDGSSDFTGDNDLVGDVSTRNFNGGAARIAGETRPRNVAFNYIVRAA